MAGGGLMGRRVVRDRGLERGYGASRCSVLYSLFF